jgi:SAM-dependent methyltransferase
MATIQLKSNNPHFGYIIGKNPESGARFKKIRAGVATGFYSQSNSAYSVFFQDSNTEISYPTENDQSFEFLNTTKYTSSLFVVHAIQNFFSGPSRALQEEDKSGFNNQVSIGMLYVRNLKHIESLRYHFPAYQIDLQELSPKHYAVTVHSDGTIYELLAFTNLFSYFFAIVNNEIMEIADDAAAKIIGLLNIVDAPYFIRYLFKVKFLIFKDVFLRLKSTLEDTTKNSIEMEFSDAWSARREAAKSVISFKEHVLDVGCGEGRYIFSIAQKLSPGKKYFALDIDSELLAKVERKVESKGFKNVEFSSSLEEFIDTRLPSLGDEKIGIIISEVIEHMEVEEAKALIAMAISIPNIDKVVVTTPDRRFNVNYFDKGMRHYDHKWEADRDEFIAMIEEVRGEYSYEVLEIGDKVDGIPCTQGVILKK